MCLLAIYMYFSEECLLRSVAYFYTRLFGLFYVFCFSVDSVLFISSVY